MTLTVTGITKILGFESDESLSWEHINNLNLWITTIWTGHWLINCHRFSNYWLSDIQTRSDPRSQTILKSGFKLTPHITERQKETKSETIPPPPLHELLTNVHSSILALGFAILHHPLSQRHREGTERTYGKHSQTTHIVSIPNHLRPSANCTHPIHFCADTITTT